MKQKGDSSNNFQIGNAGTENVFNVVQNQSRVDHVQLVVDDKSEREYEKQTLRRDRNIGWAKLAGGGMFGAIGLFSDSIGVSSYFGFSLLWMIPVGIFIGLILSIPHLRSWRILHNVPSNRNEANFIGNNEIVHESEHGKIVIYHRTAACIYPNCTGVIVLTSAPEREKGSLGRNFVGICSLAGRDHSYRIDFIWNAYPKNFDWQPIDLNAK